MAFAIAAVLTATLTAESARAIDGVRFGTVFQEAGTNTVCVSLPGPKLRLPKRLVAAFFDPLTAVEVAVTAQRAEPCSSENEPTGISYDGSFVNTPFEGMPTLGIVVTGGPYTVLSPGKEPSVRLRRPSGDVLRLRRCASTEGLHLTGWIGTRRIWHDYYYLGYSVDPTCTDEEWRE